MKYFYLLLIIFLNTTLFFGQSKTLFIKKTTLPIQIDGVINEAAWQHVEDTENTGLNHVAKEFSLNKPNDKEKASRQTIVKMTYDETFLYISAILYDTGKRVIRSRKRDNDIGDNDDFWVVVDPTGAKTNAFMFGLNAGGAQSEGQIGLNDLDLNWDNKWFSTVSQSDESWQLEIAIPFKTLRYKEGRDEWNINFIRSDNGSNETHVWSPVPVQFDGFDLGYTGKLQWDAPPKKQRTNIAIIPYLAGQSETVEPADADLSGGVGLDAKIALTSNLNLDVAINPDFSQVEVDQQVTNLTRFNIFFPERRTFFLENADIFANFGNGFRACLKI